MFCLQLLTKIKLIWYNDNANKIIFTIKDTKLYVPVVTLAARYNQKLSKLLSNGFESQKENITNEFRYFLKIKFVRVNRLFVSVYPNRNVDVKRFNARKYYLSKSIIKNCNAIFHGKTSVMNQSILIKNSMKKLEN